MAITAKLNNEVLLKTRTNTSVNITTVSSISDIGNVDTTNLNNGSVLVYSSSTNKWVSTKNLHAQDMDAGEF